MHIAAQIMCLYHTWPYYRHKQNDIALRNLHGRRLMYEHRRFWCRCVKTAQCPRKEHWMQ